MSHRDRPNDVDEPNRDAATADQLRIEAPERSRRDERIDLRIAGASPGEPVQLEATTEDADDVQWYSETTFTADADGVVDLAEQAPDDGAYDGVEPMGWLWSMSAAETDRPYRPIEAADAASIRLRASTPGGEARRTIQRLAGHPDVTERSVERDDLVGTLYLPPDAGPRPGVLALHGTGGHALDGHARLLASRGFATLALTYVGEPDPLPDEFAGIPLSYVDRAARYLRARRRVCDGQIGVVGTSRGGELAALLGARFDWIGAVVSIAGSGLAVEAPGGSDEPPWIDDGDPVPYLTMDELLDPVELPEPTAEGYLRSGPVMERAIDALDAERRADVEFAVEETDGPVLLLAGADDQVWGPRLSAVAADRLRRRSFDEQFGYCRYEDAGHDIRPPYVPTAGRRVVGGDLFGGTRSGHAHADADAWRRVLNCLRHGLAEDAGEPAEFARADHDDA